MGDPTTLPWYRQ